eukprot:COSAG06_NODE_24127_length_671_cov_266.751748_1_plen_82_part_10
MRTATNPPHDQLRVSASGEELHNEPYLKVPGSPYVEESLLYSLFIPFFSILFYSSARPYFPRLSTSSRGLGDDDDDDNTPSP